MRLPHRMHEAIKFKIILLALVQFQVNMFLTENGYEFQSMQLHRLKEQKRGAKLIEGKMVSELIIYSPAVAFFIRFRLKCYTLNIYKFERESIQHWPLTHMKPSWRKYYREKEDRFEKEEKQNYNITKNDQMRSSSLIFVRFFRSINFFPLPDQPTDTDNQERHTYYRNTQYPPIKWRDTARASIDFKLKILNYFGGKREREVESVSQTIKWNRRVFFFHRRCSQCVRVSRRTKGFAHNLNIPLLHPE